MSSSRSFLPSPPRADSSPAHRLLLLLLFTRSLPCIDGAGVTLAPKSLLSVFFFSPYPCAPRRSPPHARTCSPSPPRASSSPAHRLQLLLPVLSPACGAGVCHPRPKSVLSVFSFSPYPCAPQRSPLHTRTCSHTHTRSHAHSHAHSHTYLHTHTHTETWYGPLTPCISPADMLYT